MTTALKILGFATIVLLGCFTGALVMVLALKLGFIDALPRDEHLATFKRVYMGGGAMIWIAASLVGISTFYLDGIARIMTLLLPLLAPLVYSILVLRYFTGL
jgi:hypothetical protein